MIILMEINYVLNTCQGTKRAIFIFENISSNADRK
jgi:hypothetical protein